MWRAHLCSVSLRLQKLGRTSKLSHSLHTAPTLLACFGATSTMLK